MSLDRLPSFERPPVIETVLGVQFDPLKGFRNAHLGAFWQRLGDDWPETRDAPLLEPTHERFGEGGPWQPPEARIRLSKDPSARLQIRNRVRDRMIQVQSTRFHYNWLGQGGGEYPRYSVLRPEFDEYLKRFLEFVAEEGLGEYRPNHWEVTYVNHLPKGGVWTDPEDWRALFRGLWGPWSSPKGIQLESVGGEWHFRIPEERGRLHVQLQHMIEQKDEPLEILRLMLTARGPITQDESREDSQLGAGLDLGRERIVRAFFELTSEEAHKYWGVHNDGS